MLKSKDIIYRFLSKVKDIINRFLTKVKDIAYRFLTKVKDMSYPKDCQSLNSVGLMPNCFLKQAEK